MTKRQKAIKMALDLHKAATMFEQFDKKDLGIRTLTFTSWYGTKQFNNPKEARDLAKKIVKGVK
jgi:hypothetical protein